MTNDKEVYRTRRFLGVDVRHSGRGHVPIETRHVTEILKHILIFCNRDISDAELGVDFIDLLIC